MPNVTCSPVFPSPSDVSDRLGRFVDQYRSMHNWSVRQLSERLPGRHSRSTLRRRINQQAPWILDDACPVAEHIARNANLPWPGLWVYLADPQPNCESRCCEFEFARHCHPDSRALLALAHRAMRCRIATTRDVTFGEMPLWLVPAELLPAAAAALRPGASPGQLRAERGLALIERKNFFAECTRPFAPRTMLFSRAWLENRGRHIFAGLGEAVRTEIFESLLHDAIGDRQLAVGIVEDLHEEFPGRLADHFRPYPLVTAIDRRLLIKRQSGSFSRLWYERSGIPFEDARLDYELKALDELERWTPLGHSTPAVLAELQRYFR
jgi:hypothetical protein